MSTVRMPPILRQAVGGAREVDASGGTVREVLDEPAEHPVGSDGERRRDVTATDAHRPTVCIVEGLFFAQNLQTALVMGEARGAALMAAAEAGLDIYEIAPRKVKQAIVGYGTAQKLAVARMVQRVLNLAEPPAPDAADALALALTHALEHGRYLLSAPKKI